MTSENKDRENMKLLITIFFSVLLALAFITQYEVSYDQQNGLKILIHPTISAIFIIGIFGILFSFLEYTIDNRVWKFLAYLSFGLFISFLIGLFSTYLNESIVENYNGIHNNNGGILLAKRSNVWIFLTSIMFRSIPILIGSYTTIMVLIYLQLKKHKKSLHLLLDKILH